MALCYDYLLAEKRLICQRNFTGISLFLIYDLPVLYYSVHDHIIYSLVVTILREQSVVPNCPASAARTALQTGKI